MQQIQEQHFAEKELRLKTEERDYYQSVLNQSRSHVNRDQVKQLEQPQEKKNVIHRQNEEHYLQRGF